MPGEVERIGAVEHPEVVGLAPDDLLPARADREWDRPEFDVGVGLTELVVELERVALAVGETADRHLVVRQLREAAGGIGNADLRRAVEDVEELTGLEARIRAAVDVFLLDEARRRIVDAVVDAAIHEEQMRALDERDVVLVVEQPALEPVVIELDARRVSVLNELVVRVVWVTDEVLGLQVSRELDRTPLLRRGGVSGHGRDGDHERGRTEQTKAVMRHIPSFCAAVPGVKPRLASAKASRLQWS